MDIADCSCIMDDCTSKTTDSSSYKCGECDVCYGTICQLHEHLKSHVDKNGSYHFFFKERVAFSESTILNVCSLSDVKQMDKHFDNSVQGGHTSRTQGDISDSTDSGDNNDSETRTGKSKETKPPDHTYISTKTQLRDEIELDHFDESVDNIHEPDTELENVSEKENDASPKTLSKIGGEGVNQTSIQKPTIKVMKSTGVGTIEAIEPFRRQKRRNKPTSVGVKIIPNVSEGEKIPKTEFNVFKSCTVCNKPVMSHRYGEHMKCNSGEPVNLFECEVCGKSFYHRRVLVQHRRTHKEYKSLKCHMCPATFNGTREYKRHVNTHIGK